MLLSSQSRRRKLSRNSSRKQNLRKSKLQKRTIALLFAFLLPLQTGCETTSGTIAPGRKVPTFTASDLKGGTVSLDDFRGQYVLLNFLASWCAPCAEEMPALKGLHDEMDGDLVVVSVGVDDDDEALKKFRDRYGVDFPFLHDRDGVTKMRYRIGGFPETFLIDSNGKLVMFPDPSSGTPTLKVVGPRDWNSPPVLAMLRELID